MPSFAQSLEKTLHAALTNASDRSHEYATLEHLLLALIDDTDAAQVMTACGVELGELTEVVKQYLDQEYQSLKTSEKGDPAPTAGFQRVIQRAILTSSPRARIPSPAPTCWSRCFPNAKAMPSISSSSRT